MCVKINVKKYTNRKCSPYYFDFDGATILLESRNMRMFTSRDISESTRNFGEFRLICYMVKA